MMVSNQKGEGVNSLQIPSPQAIAAQTLIQEKFNNITLIFDGAKKGVEQILQEAIAALQKSGQERKALQAEVERLKKLCVDHKINPEPPKPKQPNRKEKRAAAKKIKKEQKKLAKKKK